MHISLPIFLLGEIMIDTECPRRTITLLSSILATFYTQSKSKLRWRSTDVKRFRPFASVFNHDPSTMVKFIMENDQKKNHLYIFLVQISNLTLCIFCLCVTTNFFSHFLEKYDHHLNAGGLSFYYCWKMFIFLWMSFVNNQVMDFLFYSSNIWLTKMFEMRRLVSQSFQIPFGRGKIASFWSWTSSSIFFSKWFIADNSIILEQVTSFLSVQQ